MQVQRVNSAGPSFGAGLYFTELSFPLLDKGLSVIKQSGVKVSKEGYKYVELKRLPQSVKERFTENKFLKNLSDKFETFVWFQSFKENKETFMPNIAAMKFFWIDSKNSAIQSRFIQTSSKVSKEDAINKMFDLLA